MQVVVNSLLVSYQQSGNGTKTVLCLHGWGDSLATFNELQAQLAKQYTVTSLDLPGFGASQAPSQAWGLAEYANFVAAFLKKLNIKKVHAIIGHSNGAAVAIYGLGEGVLHADKLILLGAAGIRDLQKNRRWALKAVAKTGRAATAWLPDRQRKQLRNKLYKAAGSDFLTVPHMQETFRKTVSQDVQVQAKNIHTPTLLIYGRQDTSTPPAYGEIFHDLIKGSALSIVDQAEHFVHHDQASQVNNLIQEFL